jgi:hypothetical protein
MLETLLQNFSPRSLLLQETAVWDGRASWPDFAAWCASNADSRCQIWLSSALLHEVMAEETMPLADDAAAMAWARPLLANYHGEAALAWPLAPWQQGRRWGVSALHGASLAALTAAAQQHRVQLRAVRPWWSQVLRLAMRQHAGLRGASARLLVVEGTRLAVLGLQRGQLAQVQMRRLDSDGPDALARWCAQAGTVNTLAVGYGMQAGVTAGASAGITVLGALDQALPAARWLSGAAS